MEARDNRQTKDLLWALTFLGLIAAVFRLAFGLGATTHLSDAVPWGLWKILNMVAGVALSTSGFTVGFLVYVLQRERFRPLMKLAVLVAFLGYGSSCLALLFDIGLPDRFWHPFLMWNEHSFLFEVFWCVMLYFTLTVIELLPTFLDRFGSRRVSRWLHRAAFALVVIGISLSSLHHSSLGSLFLVTPLRLHGLWYSSWLPWFFILSAIGGGMMFLILLRVLHARWYDPGAVFGPEEDGAARDLPMLRSLAGIAASVLGLYLLLKLGDLIRSGSWRLLAAGTWESWLYAVELALTAIVPILLTAIRRTRRSAAGLTAAAFSASAGLVLNRLDVGILGYFRDSRAAYFPSLAEWTLSLGVAAAAGLVFLAVVEHLPIVGSPLPGKEHRRFRASFDAFTHVHSAALNSGLHRITLIGVILLPLGWVLMYPSYRKSADAPVPPPLGLDETRSVLRLAGGPSGVVTEFPHADHQKRLGEKESCPVCHHLSLPNDRSTPCSMCHRDALNPTPIFDHERHMTAVAAREQIGGWIPANRSCAFCHAPHAALSAAGVKSCLECHEKDMMARSDSTLTLTAASSFLEAMHGTCLACHRREEAKGVRAGLGECGTCHPSLRPRGWEGGAPEQVYAGNEAPQLEFPRGAFGYRPPELDTAARLAGAPGPEPGTLVDPVSPRTCFGP